MAEFCKIYNRYLFGKTVKDDFFDVYQEGQKLKKGHYKEGLLCEGCGMYIVIARTEEGQVMALKTNGTFDTNDLKSISEFNQECIDIIDEKTDSKNLYDQYLDEDN